MPNELGRQACLCPHGCFEEDEFRLQVLMNWSIPVKQQSLSLFPEGQEHHQVSREEPIKCSQLHRTHIQTHCWSQCAAHTLYISACGLRCRARYTLYTLTCMACTPLASVLSHSFRSSTSLIFTSQSSRHGTHLFTSAEQPLELQLSTEMEAVRG